MSKPVYLVRMFDPEKDHCMVSQWWEEHGHPIIPPSILPRLGVVVYEQAEGVSTDLAALWLYMDNSCGVCFVERAVTAPAITMKRAKNSLLAGLDFLKKEAGRLKYGVMMLRTYPGMARFAKRLGFVADEKPVVSLSVITVIPDEGVLPCL